MHGASVISKQKIKMKNATGSGVQEAVPIGNVGVGQQWGEGISRVVLCLHPLQTPFDKALT